MGSSEQIVGEEIKGYFRRIFRSLKGLFVPVELPYSDVEVNYRPSGEGVWIAIAKDKDGQVIKETTILVEEINQEEPAAITAAR